MATSDLNRALAAFNAGRLDEARQLLTVQLERTPDNLDALYFLGVTQQASQKHEQAIALYNKVLALSPRHAGVHYNMALLFAGLGRHEEALKHHGVAIGLDPRNFWAFVNRGNSYAAMKRHDMAIADYEQALLLKPDFPEALTNKGNALSEMRLHEQALACHAQALKLRPSDPAAWASQSGTLAGLKRYDEALDSANRAIQLQPGHAEAWGRKGLALHELAREEEALASFDRAIELSPAYAQAWSGRGDALIGLNRYAEALASYDRCIALDPGYARAWNNKASALDDLGRDAEALSAYRHALALDTDHPDFRWNLAVLLIRLGEYTEGWELFENRWGISNSEKKAIATTRPRWDGRSSERTLLLWGEQGIGDQILYAGVLPDLAAFPQRKLVALDQRLIPLFARSMPGFEFIDLTQASDALDFAEQLPLGSLPRYFRPSSASFAAARQPYLRADPARVASLRQKIAQPGKLVCGVSWSSSRKSIGRQKSITLAQLLTPLASDKLHFVDLQYGDTTAERSALYKEHGITVQHVDEVDNFSDIDGLAALIQACDIVITTSNSTAHLAGALGKETLLLLPSGKGRLWYWMEHEGRNPWYPSIRISAQAQPGEWQQPLAQLKAHLENTPWN